MIKPLGILAGVVFSLTAVVAPSSTDSDRELRDLAKRVDKLERSTDEMNKKLEKLTKTVSELEKAIGSGGQSSNSARDIASRAGDHEKRIKDIEKSLEQLNRFMIDIQKEAGPKGEGIGKSFKRCDARIQRLAEWFDEYHAKKNVIHHHRDQIESIK